jgi:hypothetical protein
MTTSIPDNIQDQTLANALRKNAQNILVNGGFEVWQRGTSFSNPAEGDFTADKWKATKNGSPTVSVAQDTDEESGVYALKLDITVAAGSVQFGVFQSLENYQEYKGKTITFSASLKTSTASAYRIRITDGISTTYSDYHTGSGSYETLSVTHTVSASATTVATGIGRFGAISVSSCLVDSAMLVVGDNALSFKPEDPAVELERCQRYYQKVGGELSAAAVAVANVACASGATGQGSLRLPIEMRATPTVTVQNGTSWLVFNNAFTRIATSSISITNQHKLGGELIVQAPGGSFTVGFASVVYTNATDEFIEWEA